MQLVAIKKRLIKNKNILKITKSLKVMCMTRLRLLHEKQNILKENIEKIENIVNEQLKNSNNKNLYLEKKIYINILFFTDMSFCGTINKRNQNLFVNKLENLLIIGNKGKNINGFFLEKLYYKNLSILIIKKIKEILNDAYIGEINLFFGNQDMITIFYKKFSNMVEQEYFNCYFFHKLEEYILNFQNEECKIRLMKVAAAISNSEELNENLKNLYNKTRQQIITSELLELLSSN